MKKHVQLRGCYTESRSLMLYIHHIKAMQKAVKYFEGEHDFAAFKASGTSSKSSVRTIYKAEVLEDGERIKIELTRKWLFI